MENVFDIVDFGAVGDGKTDSTKAIQAALDAAGKVKGSVMVPPGVYMCGYIKVPAFISFIGHYAWTYGDFGGSILKLNDPSVSCMVDVTGAFGSRLSGLSINGDYLGENINGVYLKWNNPWDQTEKNGGKEDTLTIEDCRIGNFSGNACHFIGIWCFSIRHSMLCYSKKNGLYVEGCDAFLLDNWFSDNYEAGLCSDGLFMSATITGNRFECNHREGAKLFSTGTVQFTGNYFDANGACGLYIAAPDEDCRGHISIVGNFIYRNGYLRPKTGAPVPEGYDSSQVYLSRCVDTLICDNDIACGVSAGKIVPDYGIVYKQMCCSIIKDNVMKNGCRLQCMVDLGGHKEGFIVKDNVGVSTEENPYCKPEESSFPRFADDEQ